MIQLIQQACNVAAGLLMALGFLVYVGDIIPRYAKPSKASWAIWTILDGIILAGMHAEDVVNAQMIIATIGALIVLLVSLKFGESGWSAMDKACLLGAVVGIALWIITKNPLTAVITGLIVNAIGCIPTYAIMYNQPEKAGKLAWTLFFYSCVCSVIAIPEWTVKYAVQPLSFLGMNLVMMYLLYLRRRPKRRYSM